MQSEHQPFRLTLAALERVIESGDIAVLITVIEGLPGVGAKILVEESGAITGSSGEAAIDREAAKQAVSFLQSRVETKVFQIKDFAPALERVGDARLMFERLEPEPRLVICGAGHVGAGLAMLASFLRYRTTLIDDRAEFVDRERFPDEQIELVHAKNWAEAVREAIGSGRGVAVAVVTRGHNEDEECMHAVISTDPDYIGLIGSKRRTNIVLNRLRQAGASEEKLGRVRAPIGLDIGAVTPEEVALSIFAEIIAQRRGGSGGSLSAWRRE